MSEVIANVSDDLEPLLYPIDKLTTLPGNNRKGKAEAVAKSYKKFSQRKPIVARRELDGSEIVLAGNTQLYAARDILGWTHIAVSWADDLESQEATGFALADNKTHDLGEYDDAATVEMISGIIDDDEIFDAIGYSEDEWSDLLQSIEAGHDGLDGGLNEDDASDEAGDESSSAFDYSLVFDNEEQYKLWFSFVRWLKAEYPEFNSVAGRIIEHIARSSEIDLED